MIFTYSIFDIMSILTKNLIFRIKRYEDFKNFKHRIIIATDIFGRGIDIEKINVVFNFDMPTDSD